MLAMTDSLKEIIRVLQLTSPTEEEAALASAAGSTLPGGILPGTLAAKVFEAKSLVMKTGMDIREYIRTSYHLTFSPLPPSPPPPPSPSPQARTWR